MHITDAYYAYHSYVCTVKLIVEIQLKYMYEMFKLLCAYIEAQIHKWDINRVIECNKSTHFRVFFSLLSRTVDNQFSFMHNYIHDVQ